MNSGRQLGVQNFQTFVAWAASKTDDDFRAIANRGVLLRKEVAKECGFGKSALHQNPLIQAALLELENELRHRGILLPAVVRDTDAPPPVIREPGRLRATQETERLRRLEQENASLKAEVSELKRALEKHAMLRDALALTGRLPR